MDCLTFLSALCKESIVFIKFGNEHLLKSIFMLSLCCIKFAFSSTSKEITEVDDVFNGPFTFTCLRIDVFYTIENFLE